jgi:hypothetical protein
LKFIQIPYTLAVQEFDADLLPRYIGAVEDSLPNCSSLSADSLGSLVDLAFRRGLGWKITAAKDPSGRWQEMRNIKKLMELSNFEAIPEQIRGMRHIWEKDPSQKGNVIRCDAEADLFEAGLR